MDYRVHGIPGQNTGVGSLSLLQGIFPTQGSNPGLLHCMWILYQLSHQESPRILEWVAYPFSSRFSLHRNRTRVLHCRWILHQLSYQGSPERQMLNSEILKLREGLFTRQSRGNMRSLSPITSKAGEWGYFWVQSIRSWKGQGKVIEGRKKGEEITALCRFIWVTCFFIEYMFRRWWH